MRRITTLAASLIAAATLGACAQKSSVSTYDFQISRDDQVLSAPRLAVRDGETAHMTVGEDGGDRISITINPDRTILVELDEYAGGDLVASPKVLMDADSEASIDIDGRIYNVINQRTPSN